MTGGYLPQKYTAQFNMALFFTPSSEINGLKQLHFYAFQSVS